MAKYSKNSKDKLATCHPDLITLFNEVIKHFDNIILYGHRSASIQFNLFKSGRKLEGERWVIKDRKKVVTYCDGTIKKSNHNYDPSRAVDATPYPLKWGDTERIYYFAGFVMMLTIELKEQRRISHDIRWGGDWDRDTQVKDQTFMDLCHFELV